MAVFAEKKKKTIFENILEGHAFSNCTIGNKKL